MKKIYFLISGFFLLLQSNAQLSKLNAGQAAAKKRCATYEVMQGLRQRNPNTETDAQFETWIKQKIQEQAQFRLQAVVTLPVVFHIIHDNEALNTGTNVSAAAIQQQVMQLNKDFANLSYSPYGVSADMEIQFALAQNNPGGTPMGEPGIDRVNRVTAGFTAPPYTVGATAPLFTNYFSDQIKPATIWDPTRYLNIWVLVMEDGILGIATFPSSSGLPGISGGDSPTTAGAAIGPTSVGSVFAPNGGCNNSQYGKGRTLTHELGHFFGLRHIWGDGTCATDHCGDTPVHEDNNFGTPTHPKPNNCGTPDEMFENYMDYCDDVILNTFTADQKARMQAVITNSPRRNTLATSNVGLVPVTGNRISFYGCVDAITVTETGTTGTYPRYKDVSFNLQTESKATGAATVTINPAGTGVNNFHYQVLTPSIVFANGDVSKNVTIRVLDNAQVDGDRTIILGYSISGAGVQAGPTMQTITITVTDDDNVTVSESPVNLLTQDFGTSVAGWTFLSSGGTNHWVVSNAGDAGGTGNCAYISVTPGVVVAGASNTYNHDEDALAVLRTPLINSTGYSDLQLSFKYKVWGEEDIDDIYDFGVATYALASDPTGFAQIPAANTGPYNGTTAIVSGAPVINLPNNTFSNTSFYLGFYWENDGSIGNDPALNIDDILLTGNATRVEITVSNSYGSDMRSGSSLNHFRSISNNRMIADISNPNANISGLAASVTQAGTGTVALTTNTGSFFRSEKVIRLAPAVLNTTATYQATLYYTTAELAVWGVNVPNLKILKVNDGVSLASTINGSNGQVVTATVDDQRATKGYVAFTGNFTGGFSQFMLVSPTTTLPVELLSFEAKAAKKSIVLNWSTSQEINNKGFAIERSIDGTNFEKIGWVDGKLTTNSRTDYNYTDNFVQPRIIYYYRLRQTDIDDRQKLSLIRQAKIDDAGVSLSITPNPATGQVNLFISGSLLPADVQLINMQGQLVRKWSGANASAAPLKLDINGLASGIYMLQVQLPTEKLVEKIIIR